MPSQQAYSVGSGADFDGSRPITLHSAFVTRGGIDYPLAVLTQAQWNDILQKSTQSEIPEGIYYDPTFPAGTMRFWPVPIEALTVTLAIDMQLAAIADINDDLAFPPGYERALLYALAVDLAPEYPAVTLSQSVIDTADDALADIKRANNTQQQPATFDFALAGAYGRVSMARFMPWV